MSKKVIDEDGNEVEWEDELVYDEIEVKKGHVLTDTKGQRLKHPQKYKTQKRTSAERERDLAYIAELYLGGMTQMDISRKLSSERDYNVGSSQAHSDIQEIFRRWKESYLRDAHEIKVRELVRIDKLENEYWEAWELSKQEFIAIEQDKTEDKLASGDTMKPSYQRTKTKTKKEKRLPKDDYLQGIQWCIEQRCKIFGLYAPKNVNINWRKQAEEEGLNPDDIVDGLTEQFIVAATGNASLGGGSGG